MERRAARAATLGVALALLLTVACGNRATTAGSPTTGAAVDTTALDAPPYPVTRTTVTLVDPSRPTEAGTQTRAHPGRTLETDVYVPAGSGPFPLIVFAHGKGGSISRYHLLLTAWAEAGYVVAAPSFPLTNDSVPGSSDNWQNVAAQPGDVSFVLDTLLGTGGDRDGLRAVDEQAGDSGPPLSQRIDATRVGVGGHSLGGGTTYGVVFNTCCRDPRVTAAEVLSGAEFPVGVPPGGQFQLDGHVPLLIMHGQNDDSLGYHLDADVFATARPPVWFVTLIGGTHSEPYEDVPSAWDDAVMKITTGFWDATLGRAPGGMAGFEADAVVPGLTSLQAKAS
jgi:dienelactone hydrolase